MLPSRIPEKTIFFLFISHKTSANKKKIPQFSIFMSKNENFSIYGQNQIQK